MANGQDSDPIFKALNFKLCLGDSLNINKNPSGESTVGEVKRELVNLATVHQPISQATLSLATHNINNRVCSENKSARELLTKRDMMMEGNIDIEDKDIKLRMEDRHKKQQEAGQKSQEKSRVTIELQHFDQGDIVMYRDLPNHDKPRDTFIVVEHKKDIVTVRKMRMKTYNVRPEKLILVFKPSKSNPPIQPDQSLHDQLTPPPTPDVPSPIRKSLPKRPAKTKANISLKDMSAARVISIDEREKEKKKASVLKKAIWDYLVISPPVNVVDCLDAALGGVVNHGLQQHEGSKVSHDRLRGL